MDLSRLERVMNSGNIEEATTVISEVGRNKNEEVVPVLLKYLKITDNNILRNEIALALSDIGSPLAVEPIIEMLKDPKTLGSRGTLLYALQPFDCSSHVGLLVDYMINGNYEVRQEAKQLIFLMNIDNADDLLKKIKNAIVDLEERVDFLSEVLDELVGKCEK